MIQCVCDIWYDEQIISKEMVYKSFRETGIGNKLDRTEDTLFGALTKMKNELPLIEDDKREIVDDKDAYTLNDYKTFSKMLKEVRDMNDSNIIRLDSRLDLRLKLRYSEEDYNLFKSMIKSYSN